MTLHTIQILREIIQDSWNASVDVSFANQVRTQSPIDPTAATKKNPVVFERGHGRYTGSLKEETQKLEKSNVGSQKKETLENRLRSNDVNQKPQRALFVFNA